MNLKNLILGITVLFLARVLASLYFINNIDDTELLAVQRRQLLINSCIFVPMFLLFATILLISPGVEVSADGSMQWTDYKYLRNMLDLWWIAATLVCGVLLVLFGITKTLISIIFKKGIWFTGIGTIFVVLSLFWAAGYNGTAYYPSLIDINSSLSIRNSSSSEFTLTVMSFVSLLIPFVIAYIAYSWHALDKEKLSQDELEHTSKDYKY